MRREAECAERNQLCKPYRSPCGLLICHVLLSMVSSRFSRILFCPFPQYSSGGPSSFVKRMASQVEKRTVSCDFNVNSHLFASSLAFQLCVLREVEGKGGVYAFSEEHSCAYVSSHAAGGRWPRKLP